MTVSDIIFTAISGIISGSISGIFCLFFAFDECRRIIHFMLLCNFLSFLLLLFFTPSQVLAIVLPANCIAGLALILFDEGEHAKREIAKLEEDNCKLKKINAKQKNDLKQRETIEEELQREIKLAKERLQEVLLVEERLRREIDKRRREDIHKQQMRQKIDHERIRGIVESRISIEAANPQSNTFRLLKENGYLGEEAKNWKSDICNPNAKLFHLFKELGYFD